MVVILTALGVRSHCGTTFILLYPSTGENVCVEQNEVLLFQGVRRAEEAVKGFCLLVLTV